MKRLILLFLIIINVPLFAQYTANTQGHYRWRNDDGTEETATWTEAEDTPAEAMQYTNFRLRIEMCRDNGYTGFDFVLYYHETNNVTDFIGGTKITADGSVNAFKLSETSYYEQDDNALDRLTTTDGYTHALGWCNELTEVNTKSLADGSSVEIEYCLQATANAVLNDSYFFSLRFDEPNPGDGGVAYDFYDFVPELTIVENTLPVELISFSVVPNDLGLLLTWQSASEVNNLGYILEQRFSLDDAWQQIASYQTHAELEGQNTTTTQTHYEFLDSNFYNKDKVWYRLSSVDSDGTINIAGVVPVDLTSVTPHQIALDAAYPNPFNPETTIPYRLAIDTQVDLRVYDILGKPVTTLVNGEKQSAGHYAVKWNGTNTTGNSMPSGVYFIRMQAEGKSFTHKVLLVK